MTWKDDEIHESFELIDVYKTDKLDDLERLVANTEGLAHERALEMLENYHKFIDSCTGFYEDIVFPDTAANQRDVLLAEEGDIAENLEPIPF